MSILRRKFSDTDDAAFLCMMWAAHAIQDERVIHAAKFLNHPKEAATTDIASKYAVFKWDVETLINLNFNTPKAPAPVWRQQPMDTREFST